MSLVRLAIPANPAIRKLTAAALVSQLGDWAARLALAFVVFDATGLASAVGVVGALFFLPWLGPGQWLAKFGDQMDRVQLLVLCEVARAVLFLALAVLANNVSVAVLLGGVALVAVIDPVWESNRSALIVEITSAEEYASSVKLVTSVNQTAQLLGFGFGGILVATAGTSGALAINAASFAVSALLVATIGFGHSHAAVDANTPQTGALTAAREFLSQDNVSRIALIGTVAVLVPTVGFETQAPVYGEAIGLSKPAIGVMAALLPGATIVALLGLRTDGQDTTVMSRAFAISGLAAAAAAVLIGATHQIGPAWGAYALMGVPFAATAIANIVVGRRITASQRAAIFSVLQGAVFMALSAGALAGGVVLDLFGARPGNSALAALAAVLSLFVAAWALHATKSESA